MLLPDRVVRTMGKNPRLGMDMASDFERWVATLPPSMHAGLMVGEVASTAFYQALRADWTLDEICADSMAAVKRGGHAGVLVERLRTLAKNGKARVEARADRKPWQAPRYVPPEPVFTTASEVRERIELLREIGREPVTPPDDAERQMRDLIASQSRKVAE